MELGRVLFRSCNYQGYAFYRRAAYEKYIPENYTEPETEGNPIDDYVAYSTQEKPEDYPEDTPYWEDDWWMMEHQDFYQEVYLGILGNQRKDYRKVPTRVVGAKYLKYQALTYGVDRDKYRLDNPDLDEWGVLAEIWTKTMSEKRRRLGLSASEKMEEEVQKIMEKIQGVGSRR